MDLKYIVSVLEGHGIKVTANRVLVLKALMEAGIPMTMSQLEDYIGSLDKSSIFRALVCFREHHLVHSLEVCDEGSKYELCHSDNADGDSDEHVHFHCSVCHRTFCFEEIPIPYVAFPEGFQIDGVNYIASGICPDCLARRK